ncbi:hypothetical protein CAEBREN_14513 [Caenorhabditis brenneri]|uniref:Protein kinase domain-containing protein n=1 Tax=Caenorhabditis brenneri TaxID=135651 RepID=G0P586_CAEBE|nr:hypothetical protein CAEBREN_14513 [Caenorhabditis brenneri]
MENKNVNFDVTLDVITVGKIKYTPEDRLGCGAFGTVFKGRGSDKTTVAIKHQYIRPDNNRAQILEEYRIHKDMSEVDKAGFVVKMIGMLKNPKSIIMVLEFAPESLHTILGKLTPVQVQKYFRQLINGVEFIHSNHVAHCDLSLKNLLLSDGNLKIADFGRAKRLISEDQEFPSTDCRGTPKFCAPEVCVREPVLVKPFPLDVWSCGVVLMQLTQNSEDSWREARVQVQEYDKWVAKKKSTGSDFWYNIPPAVMNLLRKILEADISKRATIIEIKNSPYFKKDEKEPIKRSGAATRSSGKRARY